MLRGLKVISRIEAHMTKEKICYTFFVSFCIIHLGQMDEQYKNLEGLNV